MDSPVNCGGKIIVCSCSWSCSVNEDQLMGSSQSICLSVSFFRSNGTEVHVAGTNCCVNLGPGIISQERRKVIVGRYCFTRVAWAHVSS